MTGVWQFSGTMAPLRSPKFHEGANPCLKLILVDRVQVALYHLNWMILYAKSPVHGLMTKNACYIDLDTK